jgi:hypothetical protein
MEPVLASSRYKFQYLPVGVHENSKTCPVFRHPERGVTTQQDCRYLHSYFVQNEHRQAHRAHNEPLHRPAHVRHWHNVNSSAWYHQTKNSDAPWTWPAVDMRKEEVSYMPPPPHEQREVRSARFFTATIKMWRSTYITLTTNISLISPSGYFIQPIAESCPTNIRPPLSVVHS